MKNKILCFIFIMSFVFAQVDDFDEDSYEDIYSRKPNKLMSDQKASKSDLDFIK